MSKRPIKYKGYKLIRKNTRNFLKYQAGTFIFAHSTIIISVVLINYMQILIDMVQSNHYVISIYGKLIASCLLYAVLMIIFQLIFKRTQARGANEVTILLYNKLQEKPLAFFKDHNSGELISLINNEGKEVGNWITSGSLVLLQEFCVLIFNMVMMLYYNITLTLILTAIMMVFFLSTKVLASKMANLSSSSLKMISRINQFIVQTLKSEKLILILNKQNWFKKRFADIIYNEKYPIDNKKADYTALYMTVFTLLSVLLPILSVVIGASMASKHHISIGALLAFYAHTSQIQEPVRYIPEFLSDRKNILTMSEHLLPIVEDNVSEIVNPVELPTKVNRLSVAIEYFSYDNEKRLLENTKFEISANEIILIKGNSGVGKSTLVDIIMGFISSDKAVVLQENINCSYVTNQDRWKHMLLTDQASLLLEGSLKENLFLEENYPDELINEVIYTACLEDYVIEHGMEKNIGGENQAVSGGQKQRIGLARILLRKPDIIILDEPTSALDNFTSYNLSKRVVDFIKKYHLALIVVSHKSDFDNYANKILELQ